jgi:hypothetical protein
MTNDNGRPKMNTPSNHTAQTPHPLPAATRQPSHAIHRARYRRCLLSLAAVLAITGTVRATTVIQTFNEVTTAGGAVPAQNASLSGLQDHGTGFISTTFPQNTSALVMRTNDLTPTLANYVSGQGSSGRHWAIGDAPSGGGPNRRNQTQTFTATLGTVWFSFQVGLQTPNGDAAVLFGAAVSTGQIQAGSKGVRIGVGHSARPGALGISVASVGASDGIGLDKITNNVNGVITANNFAPTNGTPGVVLGKIWTDPDSGHSRVDVWYNPDVANEASLPAATLSFVDTNNILQISSGFASVAYQVFRYPSGGPHELIDCFKLSDEANAFDIVYKNAAVGTPLVSVMATVPVGSETGPTNLVFKITSDRVLTAPLTVTYTLSGVATNGYDGLGGFTDADYADLNFDTGTGSSSVTIPAGSSNATVTLSVIDDAIPEGDESVVLTLGASVDYRLGTSVATASILDNNDAHVSVQYMFTQTLQPQVWDPNLTATAMNTAGVGGSYSGVYLVSPNASYYASGSRTGASEAEALANGNYLGFTVAPRPGFNLTLTNLNLQAIYGNYLYQQPSAASATVFVRSSLDNFAANLASWTLEPDTTTPGWTNLDLALGSGFVNLFGPVEFRVYVYDDSTMDQVAVRLDNLYLSGTSFPAVAGQQVCLSSSVLNATNPATLGQFTVLRYGATATALTVRYTLGGTSSNGVDYVLLPGTVTIPAGQTNAVVTVTPTGAIPGLTQTLTLTLAADPAYAVLPPSSATMTLVGNGDPTPVFAVAASGPYAYERLAALSGTFTFTRIGGDPGAAVTVDFTLGGGATLGKDYIPSATNSIAFGTGVTTRTISIVAVDNSLADGDRTVTLTVQSPGGYFIKPPAAKTVVIVDDEAPGLQTVLSSVSGGMFSLSWAEPGWTLQAQTNGLGTNWVTIPGSSALTAINLPINPANQSVFYRLVQPSGYSTNYFIYRDTLAGGWFANGWGGSYDPANTSPVYSGTESIAFTLPASGGVGPCCTPGTLNTTPYSALTFWINGGATGGQGLTLQVVRNWNVAATVPLLTLPANTWVNYTLPLSSIGVANVADFNGIRFTCGTNVPPVFYVDEVMLSQTMLGQ